ncbi:hypothetical protein C0Q70_01935 [Pomacea canaliculata]|uniref:PCNA-associated factor n=1 Tax=Pomacea canaliculata TaxID=400727 RepID=A0A2T7Q0V4_POMCA|nr:hypothetical protein C0Q70_01935 [Pomacea canaliculata]
MPPLLLVLKSPFVRNLLCQTSGEVLRCTAPHEVIFVCEGKKYAGGNPVCPRPTPDWQKGIDSFFTKKPADKENEEPDEEAEEEAGPSGLSSGCCASDVSNCPNSPCGPGFSSSVGGSSSNNNKDYTSTQDSTDDDS